MIEVNGNRVRNKGYKFFVKTLDTLQGRAKQVFEAYCRVMPKMMSWRHKVIGVAFNETHFKVFWEDSANGRQGETMFLQDYLRMDDHELLSIFRRQKGEMKVAENKRLEAERQMREEREKLEENSKGAYADLDMVMSMLKHKWGEQAFDNALLQMGL